MSSVATQTRLWYLQRASAVVLAVCVVVHLATLVYAVRGGLTGSEILDRTQGNAAVAGFYGVFVIASAVHAPIGIARLLEEWLGWGGRASNAAALLFAAVLLATGMLAIYALVVS